MNIFEQILPIVLPIITGGAGWMFSKLQTAREKKESDLELINRAIRPLLESIADLAAKVQESQENFMQARERILEHQQERTELLSRIADLEKEVKRLSNLVKKFTKNDKEKENITTT